MFKLYILQFYGQTELFSKHFEDIWASSLWVSWILVLEFGPILAWYRFPASEEFVVVFDLFLMMRQMFSIGERSGLFRQTNSAPGLFYYEAMLHEVIAAVFGFAFSCWNTQGLPWNRCRLKGSMLL